jgi:hypothetical protein
MATTSYIHLRHSSGGCFYSGLPAAGVVSWVLIVCCTLVVYQLNVFTWDVYITETSFTSLCDRSTALVLRSGQATA